MQVKYKKSKIGPVMWIAFLVLLALAVLVLMHKAGILTNKTLASLKQTLNPFA